MKKILFSLFTLLIIPSLVFAEITWERYEYFSNSGGLNDAFSSIVLDDKEATDLQNVVFTTSGSFKTRDGFDELNASTLGASVITTGLKYYRPTSGARTIVGVFSDDKIRKMDYAAGGAPDGTWDDITGVLSFNVGQNDLASFAIGEDILIIEDGLNSTAPYQWTGSGNASALGGSPPNATMVAYHKRMAFAAGNDTNPSTLYFSDVGDIENWTTGLSGNVSIETNDGSILRAIVPGFDALYIFKDYSIWRLSGEDKDTFVLQRMISDIGTLSPNSIALIGSEVFFMSGQGDIYVYDGATGLRIISVKIEGSIDAANFSRFQYVSSAIFDSDYYLTYSLAGSGTHNSILVYDTFNQSWSKFNGINANAMAIADDGVGEEMLIFGDYGGFVYNYPEGTNDAGTAINAYYLTKQYRFPESTPFKDWKLLKVFANQEGNYNLNIELRTDFQTAGVTETMNLAGSGSLWDTAIFDTDTWGGQQVVIGRIEPNLEGNFFQIRFSNSTLDQPFEVRGFQIFIEGQDRI